jgi:hypothetical protein
MTIIIFVCHLVDMWLEIKYYQNIIKMISTQKVTWKIRPKLKLVKKNRKCRH